MAGPSRPKPPSAIDGYRRLERTRRVAPDSGVVVATAAVAPRSRRIRPARIAGIMRLAGFVAVLAIIIGTSVSLASADTRRGTQQAAEPVAAKAPAVHTVTAKAAPGKAEPDEVSDPVDVAATAEEPDVSAAAAEEPAVEATAVAGVADVPDAAPAAVPRARALPFTGELEVLRILLVGSTLVLFGMLVQIAGQPLPADRARARTR